MESTQPDLKAKKSRKFNRDGMSPMNVKLGHAEGLSENPGLVETKGLEGMWNCR